MNSNVHKSNETAVPQRSLWFGFFAAAFAFSLEGFVAYVISSRACFIGDGSLGPISPGGVRWLLAAITAVLFGLALWGAILSYRNWRRLSATPSLAQAEGNRPKEFVALCGVLISFVLSVGIVWCSLTLAFLNVCMREH